MPEPLEIQEFDRIIDCGRDLDFNTDLNNGIVRVRSGLSPEEYVRIGMKIGERLPTSRNIPITEIAVAD